MAEQYSPMEPDREGMFKDAVLTAAEARGMEIVAEATRKMEKELQAARLACEEISYEGISRHLQHDTEKEYSAAMQQARRELLQYRAGLVDDVFDGVREELVRFTKTKAYKEWLLSHLRRHTAFTGKIIRKGEEPVVYLRRADLHLEAEVKMALTGCRVEADPAIAIGGLKLVRMNALYDETLDAALEEARQAFFAGGELTV